MKKNTLVRAGTVAVLAAVMLTPMLADAQAFVQGGTQMKLYLVQLLTPLIGVAVIVFGVLALTGRTNWMLAVGAILGVIAIFGHEQIVSLFRGFVGL